MSKALKIPFLCVLVVGMLVTSCRKTPLEDLSSSQNKESPNLSLQSSPTQDIEGLKELGQQFANPLTTANMLQAWNKLYDEQLTSLDASHHYVRFLPTIEEYETLQDIEGLELFDYPFDREVIQAGSYYHDPTIPSTAVTWQYAVVPADFISPVSNTEILAEMVVVEYNSHWVQEAYRNVGVYYDGEPYGIFDSKIPTIWPPERETGGGNGPDIVCPPGCVKKLRINYDTTPASAEWYCDCTGGSTSDPVTGCGCTFAFIPRKPNGAVRVWDTQHNGGQWEGVQGVKVSTWREGIVLGQAWTKSTFTDANGCWQIDHEYKKPLNSAADVTIAIRVKFKNGDVVIRAMDDEWDLSGYFEPVQHLLSKTGDNFNNICIDYHQVDTDGDRKKRYYAATAMNAYYEYNGYAAQDGVDGTGELDILIQPFTTNAGAPMFDRINGPLLLELTQIGPIKTIINFVTVSTLGSIINALIGPTWAFIPDIIYGYQGATLASGGQRSDQIKETLYHEFAHASHYSQVGSSYWVDNIRYVVGNSINGTNPPYGVDSLDGSGRTAVIEMWSYHYGPTLADRRYGLEHSNFVGALESPLQKSHLSLLETRRYTSGFIPAGLNHDLIDFNPPSGGFENTFVTNDVIGGFTHADIFSQMDASILSPSELKTPLNGIAPSGVTSIQLDSLFADYEF